MHRAAQAGFVTGMFLFSPLLIAGCNKETPPPLEDPLVQVSLPVEREIADYYEFQGRTTSVYSVDVRAQVTGYLRAIYFKEGTEVVGANQAPVFIAATAGLLAPLTNMAAVEVACSMQPFRSTLGDPLFQIDPDIYVANVAKTDADVQSAKAGVISSRAAYEIEVNSKEGSSQLTRTEKLGQFQQAQAQLLMAEANLTKAKKDLGFCTIYAPISGKIGNFRVTQGNLVQANMTLLTNIVSVSTMWVEFDVDDMTMLRIQKDMIDRRIKSSPERRIPVTMALSINKDDYPYRGEVDFVDNQVRPSTGTIVVRARFDNPLLVGDLRALTPGLFCRVRVALGEPEKHLLIAERAIGLNQGQRYVLVANAKDEVLYRPIKVGRLDDGLRVVLEGIHKEDRIIVIGLVGLRPGMKVRTDSVPMPRAVEAPKGDSTKASIQK